MTQEYKAISTTTPTVSVIIPCRNEKNHIELCIRSVMAQESPPGGFEIIVADGMSKDGTREILERLLVEDSRLKLVDNPGRIPAAGLNVALRVARGRILVRADAHTEYARDYIRQCVAILEETGAHMVGGPAGTVAKGYMQSAIRAAFHSPFATGGARFHQIGYEGPVDTVTYGAWPRRLFDHVGVFDEELGRNEDDDFSFRIKLAGGVVWQSPRIRSWYQPRQSLLLLFRQYMQYGYWKVRVIQKHRRPASPRHLVPICFVLALGSLAAAAILWPPALQVLFALVTAYAACAVWASMRAAARHGWRLLPVLPFVIACYHFAYGLGFLRGVLDFVLLKRKPHPCFSSLTRTS